MEDLAFTGREGLGPFSPALALGRGISMLARAEVAWRCGEVAVEGGGARRRRMPTDESLVALEALLRVARDERAEGRRSMPACNRHTQGNKVRCTYMEEKGGGRMGVYLERCGGGGAPAWDLLIAEGRVRVGVALQHERVHGTPTTTP